MRFPDLRALRDRARDATEAGAVPEAAAPAGPPSVWPPARQEVTDALWGEGCIAPGGAEEVLRLAAPLGLASAASLLLLGAGGGGPALRLAADVGAWVSVCEHDAGLREATNARVQHATAALSKWVTVEAWAPAKPAFRKGFNHAIAIESLHGSNAAAVLTSLVQALRPGGHMVLQQTVAGPRFVSDDPALLDWCRLEQRPPPRFESDWITPVLRRLRCDVRPPEDGSARQMQQAIAGWMRMVERLEQERQPRARAALILAEAELWQQRVALLRGGQLRLMTWHAALPSR